MFFILGYFLTFYSPPNSPKNQNFKKNEKASGDIIILQKCAKNHDYMLYCSGDMTLDTCNCCFSFWAIFDLLPPLLTTQKIKIKKKKEKKIFWRFHHFTHVHVYHKLWLDDVQFLRYGAGQMEGQTDRQLSRGGCST